MKTNIEQRAADLAVYIIETFKLDPSLATVRAAATKFGISKSTVHKDLSERLEHCNRALYLQVKEVLETNKAERHLRGGEATKRKYKESR
ncbi:MAG: sporulation transcriptional regulator SpoIIID [Oscillospiraceae bacterium]|nr:sporulation transcriptional regulator SpoIIID [Oscillospiraceae bacterium]